MRIIQFESEEQKENIIEQQKKEGYVITEISFLVEGNYLGFTKESLIQESIEKRIEQLEELKQENQLLKAQNNALSERADFIEGVVAEMATLADKHEETLQLKKMNEELRQTTLIALEGVAILNEEVQQIKKNSEASAN